MSGGAGSSETWVALPGAPALTHIRSRLLVSGEEKEIPAAAPQGWEPGGKLHRCLQPPLPASCFSGAFPRGQCAVPPGSAGSPSKNRVSSAGHVATGSGLELGDSYVSWQDRVLRYFGEGEEAW